MTSLIACLTVGKGTWLQVHSLVMGKDWESVFLITNELGREKFSCTKKIEFVVVDSEKPAKELVRDIKAALDGRFSDLEVALNIASGTGKEHMAIIAAILESGLSFRLVDSALSGVQEL